MNRNRFAAFLFLLFILACHASEEDRVRQTLNRRGEALQKKDLSLYLSCISKDYQDKDGDFFELQKRITFYFNTFNRIAYNSWNRSIQIEGETATVTQQFQIEIEKGEARRHYSGTESFLLRREGESWKIFRGF